MGGFFHPDDVSLENKTTMTYGNYTFSPVPLVNISKEINKADGGQVFGTSYSMTLNGQLTPLPTGTNGISNVTHQQELLKLAFAATGEGKLFQVKNCGSPILECFPKIRSIDFAEGNWVDFCDFTLELEYDYELASGTFPQDGPKAGSGIAPPLVQSADESWSIEKNEQNFYDFSIVPSGQSESYREVQQASFNISHSISAVGKRRIEHNNVIKEAWQEASGYVVPKLGFDYAVVGNAGGAICFNKDEMVVGNHIRSVNFSELGGSYEVEESWTVYPSSVWTSGINALGVSDVWEINVENSYENSLTTVTINGTIEGSESGVYCNHTGSYQVLESKYDSALGYFNQVADAIFYNRAFYFGTGLAYRPINPEPKTKSLGHSPSNGTITYNYSFDDRPGVCIEGARTTSLSVNDTNPTDIFAELTVLGRSNGPVIQSMGTTTSRKREVSLDAVMPVQNIDCNCTTMDSAPSDEAETILLTFRPDNCNGGVSYTIVKHIDTESWNPTTGQYSRQMGWTYGTCGS